MDDDLDLTDGLDDDIDTGSADSDDGDTGAPPATKPDGDGKQPEDKRVSDLMSKWQKAEARAKRAEELLKAKQGDGGQDKAAVPPEVQQWVDAAREQAREQFFASEPRLSQYGLSSSVIAGDTPDQMRSSLKAYRDLIDGIETKVQNEVLVRYGLVAEAAGSTRVPTKDFASMSDEEFEKEVARVSTRGYF